MFTMKYSQMTGGFAPSLQKLVRMPLPTKTAYAIKKITDAVTVEQKKMRKSFNELYEQYAKKDEKGALQKDEHGDVIVDEAKMEEFQKAQETFGEKEFVIHREKLSLALFSDINISAAELSALDPILQDPEEAPVAPVVELHK